MLWFLVQPALTPPDIQNLAGLSFSLADGPLSELFPESSGLILALRLRLKPTPAKFGSGASTSHGP